MKKFRQVLLCKAAMGIFTAAIFLSGCQKQTEDMVESQPMESVVDEKTEDTKEAEQEETIKEGQLQSQIKIPSFSKEEYPKVDGSTATLPLSIVLYQLSTGISYEEAQAEVYHSKTMAAYYNLIDDSADLVIAYEPDSSVFEMLEDRGVQLEVKPIGKDALVFMANMGNPVESLTGQQLVDIYSGKIQNWSETGGDDKGIVAFQRPKGSGSQTLMEKLVMKGIPMKDAPTTEIASEMGELIEAVASYNNQQNALGYSVYFYARNMYQRPELRFMAVDGVMPDNETIRDGSYPYVNEFYAAVRADEPKSSPAYQLFTWLTTEDGQSLVEELGYVGVGEGKKQLGFDWKQLETGDTSISLKGSRHLMMDGMFAYGEPGVALFSQDMQSVRFIENLSIDNNILVVSLDEPVIVSNETGDYGLYDFNENKWILEPNGYGYISKTEYGYYSAYTQQGILEFDVQGKQMVSEAADEFRVGEYIWKGKAEDGRAEIYDQAGNLVNQADVSGFGIPDRISVRNDSYVVWSYDQDGPWRFVLCDSKGNVIFTWKDISEEDMVHLNQSYAKISQDLLCGTISRDGSWIEIQYAGKYYIFDLVQKKVVTGIDDILEVHYANDKYYYMVISKDDTAIYEKPGVKMTDKNKIPYTKVYGGHYMGYQDGNVLIIDNLNSGERIELASEYANTDMGCRVLADGVFRIRYAGYDLEYLYHKDKLLDSGSWIQFMDYDEKSDKYQIVTVKKEDNANVGYIFDSLGNLVYTSSINDEIILAEKEFFVSYRGSYLQIMDYDGNTAVKMLRGYMVND